MEKKIKRTPIPQYTIILVISDPNFVDFQKKVAAAKDGKVIYRERTGVSLINHGVPGQIAVIACPWCYIEYECTKEEHERWTFQSTLIRGGME